MYNLQSSPTQAPDVNQESQFFKGYSSGWEQMSDAMTRVQKKRELDQQDRRLALEKWKTQIEASVSNRQIAASERANELSYKYHMADIALKTEAQEAEMQKLPLLIQGAKLDIEDKKLKLSSATSGLDALREANKKINEKAWDTPKPTKTAWDETKAKPTSVISMDPVKTKKMEVPGTPQTPQLPTPPVQLKDPIYKPTEDDIRRQNLIELFNEKENRKNTPYDASSFDAFG